MRRNLEDSVRLILSKVMLMNMHEYTVFFYAGVIHSDTD